MADSIVLKDLTVATMAPDDDNDPFGPISDAVLAIEDGVIKYVGPQAGFDDDLNFAISMQGKLAMPGFVACHNQICWAGEAAGLATDGAAYREIVKATAKATSTAEDDTLLRLMRHRLEQLTCSGVTAFELKSGFGLTPTDELRLTLLCKQLQADHEGLARVTLFAGHFIPEDSDPDAHIEEIERDLLPKAYESNACDAVEVLCDDDSGLDLDQASTILEAFYRRKTPTRVACDRFNDSAGATLPASFYSKAATFLNHADDMGVESIASVGTTVVLVPEAANQQSPPPQIAAMRETGAHIALAPHSGPDGSGALDILAPARLALEHWDLTPAEALLGITIHAAAALGVADQAGTLQVGKRGDLAIFDVARPQDVLSSGVHPVAIARAGAIMALGGENVS